MSGLFVTFEGPDGCGKSTIANLIYERLKDKFDIIKTREPGGTLISEKIRDLVLDKDNKDMDYRTEALLYAASRAQHVAEKIKPSLEKDKIVLCERFVLSSIAYQGYGRDLDIKDIKMINNFATGDIQPDIIFLFDTKDKWTLNRKIKSGGDRIENSGSEFHKRVMQGYKELSKDDQYFVIDATKGIDEVLNDCLKVLNKKVGGII
ncbi:MAG: dTMP kinase [Peptoniphilaceae bacterium]